MPENTAIEIKIAIMRAGTSQAQLARELKVTRQSVGRVIKGQCISKKIEDYLAPFRAKAA